MKARQKKLSGLRIKQQALYIMIFSFVTVVIWISGSLFRSQSRTGISPDLLELAKPLSPNINVDIIDSIEARKVYSDQELYNFQIYKLIKSKDGRTQQVVPIESDLNEIPDDQIQVFIQEDQNFDSINAGDRISNQSNLGEQLDSGSGTFSLENEQNPSSSLTPTSTPRASADPETGVVPPGFGEDGRYYLD